MRVRIILTLVGLALLAAGGLKAIALSSPVSHPAPPQIADSWIQLAIIQYEILLGLWLLSGVSRLGAWGVAVLTFGFFSAVNLWSGLIGQSSCGCFGVVQVNPWLAFGVDSAAFLLLVLAGRPNGVFQAAEWDRSLASMAGFAGSVVFVLAAWSSMIHFTVGTTDAALAILQGRTVFASRSVVSLGAVRANRAAYAKVEIFNRSEQAVQLVGGTSDCSLNFVVDLPLDIPAGESRTILLRVNPASSTGNFGYVGAIWTDAPGHFSLPIVLTGRFVEP